MKYYVIFDSNFLWQNAKQNIDKFSNLDLLSTRDFIKENGLADKIKLLIPEIVFKERIAQAKDLIEGMILEIDKNLEFISKLGISKQTVVLDGHDWTSVLNEIYSKFLTENQISLIEIPPFDQKDLVMRAVDYKEPFRKSGKRSDMGFKDTLVWLTLLQHSKDNKDSGYIFCSKDEGFISENLIEEFRAKTGNTLEIVKDPTSIKEYLDKELGLKLKLQEKYSLIKEEVKKNAGELAVQAQKFIKSPFVSSSAGMYSGVVSGDYNQGYVVSNLGTTASAFSDYSASYIPLNISSVAGTADNTTTRGYDLFHLSIEDILEEDEKVFLLDIKMDFIQRTSPQLSYTSGFIYSNQSLGLIAKVRFNEESKSIEILSAETLF
jgi:hypothetical protein